MVGTGYVGLVTGACFAEMGHHVICLDVDANKIATLNNGQIPFYEPGLEEIVKRNIEAKRLSFTTNYEYAVKHSYIIFLALPTPSSEDGSCNTTYVMKAAEEIAKHMTGYRLIVNKSTAEMGTVHKIQAHMKQMLSHKERPFHFGVASNPEFLKEGSAVQDCLKPDRIVVGTEDDKSLELLRNVYAPFTINHDCLISMDILSSEMTKYAANAMLATRISFMNEMAHICEKIGANINYVRKGIGSDNRIGYSFLYAGIGYGGSCFPKDVKALIHASERLGCPSQVLKAVDSVNNEQKLKMAYTIEKYFESKGGLKDKTIALWGLSFKPDTDDMREAPSLQLINFLKSKGATLRLYDPIAMAVAKNCLNDHTSIHWCKDEKHAAEGSDAIILVTEWKQFRLLDFGPIIKKMKGKAFFDGRNQYKACDMHAHGFDYYGIGVKPLVHKTE
jgi:UDPglucose 6-dehydrogenase